MFKVRLQCPDFLGPTFLDLKQKKYNSKPKY